MCSGICNARMCVHLACPVHMLNQNVHLRMQQIKAKITAHQIITYRLSLLWLPTLLSAAELDPALGYCIHPLGDIRS